MNKQEYHQFLSGIRKDAKQGAQRFFQDHPDIMTLKVPYFQPLIASCVDRVGWLPLGDMEFIEVIYDSEGNIIHEKWGSDWRMGCIEVKRGI